MPVLVTVGQASRRSPPLPLQPSHSSLPLSMRLIGSVGSDSEAAAAAVDFVQEQQQQQQQQQPAATPPLLHSHSHPLEHKSHSAMQSVRMQRHSGGGPTAPTHPAEERTDTPLRHQQPQQLRSRKPSLDLIEQAHLHAAAAAMAAHNEDSKILSPQHGAAAPKRRLSLSGCPLPAPTAAPAASLRPCSRAQSPAPHTSMHAPSRSFSGVEAAYAELKRSRAPSIDFGVVGLSLPMHGALPSLVSVVPQQQAAPRAQPTRNTQQVVPVRAWQAAEDSSAAARSAAAAAASAADTLSLLSPRNGVSRPLQASSRTRPSSPHRVSPLQVQLHGAAHSHSSGAPSPVDEKLLSPHHVRPLFSHSRSASGRSSPTQCLPPLGANSALSACNSPALRVRRLSMGGGADAAAARSSFGSAQPSPSASCSGAVAASMMIFRAGGSVGSSPTATSASSTSASSCSSTPASNTAAQQNFYSIKSPSPLPSAAAAVAAAPTPAAAKGAPATAARAFAFLRTGGGGLCSNSSCNPSPNATPNLQTRQLARLEARAADSLNASPALMSRRLSVQQSLQPLQQQASHIGGALTPRLEHLQRRLSPHAAAAAAAAAVTASGLPLSAGPVDDDSSPSHSQLLGRARGLSVSVECGEGFLAPVPVLLIQQQQQQQDVATASPLSQSQSQSMSPSSDSFSAQSSAPSSGSVGPARAGTRGASDSHGGLSVPMSPLCIAVPETVAAAAATVVVTPPPQQREQEQKPETSVLAVAVTPAPQRSRRPMVAPILLAPPVAAVSFATALEAIPAVPAPVVVATAAALVTSVPAPAPRRRFIPPPITLPVDIPDEESTPLTASPTSDEDEDSEAEVHDDDDDDVAQALSPSPICSPAAATVPTPSPASAQASLVLPDTDRHHDRKASLGLLARRRRSDDEDCDAALLREVHAATLAAAESSPPPAASAGAVALGLGAAFDMSLPAAFVLPDAPRASFSNYARAVLDELSLGSPSSSPHSNLSPSSSASRSSTDSRAQVLSICVAGAAAAAAGASTGGAAPFVYAEDAFSNEGEDADESDDAADFWDAMDSGAYRLF